MNNPPPSGTARGDSAFVALRQFAQRRSKVEVCELCSSPLAPTHQHLTEPAARRLICACDACAILFSSQTSSKFKRVPRRVRSLSDFSISDAQWDGLMIPIELAFFLKDGGSGKVSAFYPGPAGAIESLLSLETWSEIESQDSAIREMEPDVEALLANRVGINRGFPAQYYVIPIDECYRLVGLIRMNWHGLSGGTEVWREVTKFFAGLKEKAQGVVEKSNA